MASAAFTLYTPVYATITVVCTIFLYLSYVVPCALGARAHGRSWTIMGPWDLGVWYRPLAIVSTVGLRRLDRDWNATAESEIDLGRWRLRARAGDCLVYARATSFPEPVACKT